MYYIRNREGLPLTVTTEGTQCVVAFSRRKRSILAFGSWDTAFVFYNAIRHFIADEIHIVSSDDLPVRPASPADTQ